MNMETIKAVVFILRALIEMFMYLTGKIEADKFHANMSAMRESIKKATTGELPGRLEGGREVEDRFNQNVKE